MTDPALEQLVDALSALRAKAVPLVLARQERRREGATVGERMSTPQHIALLALADGPVAISDVAAASGVAVSTATRMVQGLEREGWVERATSGPGDDRRRRPVTLTPAGRAAMEDASDVLRGRFRSLLGHLDAGERRAVLEGLHALTKAIQVDDNGQARPSAPSNSSTVGASDGSADAPSGRMPSKITPR
jgi:DNA-binding MarR family transcriptional regulator